MNVPRVYRLLFLLALVLCLDEAAAQAPVTVVAPKLESILRRYRESLGGLANLERIRTVRIEGEILLGDESVQRITVLKKKPNRVRTIINTGNARFIQGFDGTVAWAMFERLGRTYVRQLEGEERENFVRKAPIENVFINPRDSGATLTLGEPVFLGLIPCYQLVADFPDGTRQVNYIDQNDFRDRRVFFYGRDGELESEYLPTEFENFGGILFAMRMARLVDDRVVSTMVINLVELNVGLYDSLFEIPSPPAR